MRISRPPAPAGSHTPAPAPSRGWTRKAQPLTFSGHDVAVGHLFEGTVPEPVLSPLVGVHDADDAGESGGTVSAETGLENLPPSTFEGYDGNGWPTSFFQQVAGVSGHKARAISRWAEWARWVACGTLGIEQIDTATTRDGHLFPEAIARRTTRGILCHVDSPHEEYPGTELDLGPQAVTYSFITYLTTHSGRDGSLVVYDVRPLDGADSKVSYPLDPATFWPVDTVEVKPLVARSVLIRSDHAHEVLPTRTPRAFVTMFVVVAADGRAISFG